MRTLPSPWRRVAEPPAWRALVVSLVVVSLPFFVRGFLALPSTPVPTWFLLALFGILFAANLCILEMPPYRFLHLTSGLVLFGGFFVTGPAILALLALSLIPSEIFRRSLPPLPGFADWPPLGGTPREYAVPVAAITITLGTLDLVLVSLGFTYPFVPDAAGSEALLYVFLFFVYVTILALIEIGVCLRFGMREALRTEAGREGLVVYLLSVLVGAPIVPAMARVYGPEVWRSLFALGWTLWAFGIFGVVGVLIRRRRTIVRLAAAVARQERLAALGRLASVIAHQTRHHLGVLNMSAYVLGETLARETLTPEAQDVVANELEAIARTRSELDELLAQELGGAGEEKSFGLLALARECGRDLEPMAASRNVPLRFGGGERHVRGDRLRLKQAIANVLRNAIEASPGEATVDVAVEAETNGEAVVLAIRDRGPGLSSRARERLFEPLFTEKQEGLGMGLYVSRTIVEAHGGELALGDASPGVRAEIRLAIDEGDR
jgi:signal transduction histidine kinase